MPPQEERGIFMDGKGTDTKGQAMFHGDLVILFTSLHLNPYKMI